MSADDASAGEPQNIYDDVAFFDGYATLARSTVGLDGAPEWPTLRSWLPPLADGRVADLGCGYGWFCRWAATQSASEVVGYDVSARMLERAEATTTEPVIRYVRADLAMLALPPQRFDLVYSSLALHYLAEVAPLLASVRSSLVEGGRFVFSIEHPIYMASTRPDWVRRPDGELAWPVDHYAEEGRRVTNWLADGVVKYHRTVGTLLTALIDAGLTIERVADFAPDAAQVSARPELAPDRERPMFLLVAARAG